METGDNVLKEGKNKAGKIIKTGYSEIDRRLKLLKEGELTLLLGRPSMGKSMIALNMAAKLVSFGEEVCYISFELEKEDIINKLLATKQVTECQLKQFYVSDIPYSPLRARELLNTIKTDCPQCETNNY